MNSLPIPFFLAISVVCAQTFRPSRTECKVLSDSLPQASCASKRTKRAGATNLGIRGTVFTRNGKPTFLLGISYYGALGASEPTWKADLDQMQRDGFHWLRVWATWDAFDNDISAVDSEGRPREPYLGKLKTLLAECDRRGLIIDVTLSRGSSAVGPARLSTYEAHQRAVETLVKALRPWRNWYLDLANERNVRDPRYVSIEDLARLRAMVRHLDLKRLVTASHGGDLSRENLRAYLLVAQLDFVSPHRPRQVGSAEQTETTTRELLAWMKEIGRVAPVHYQEPFRRGYGDWQPRAEDFSADLNGARAGGAAGWCFHNGSNGKARDGRPRRSFDLRYGPLFAQLDDEERVFLQGMPDFIEGR